MCYGFVDIVVDHFQSLYILFSSPLQPEKMNTSVFRASNANCDQILCIHPGDAYYSRHWPLPFMDGKTRREYKIKNIRKAKENIFSAYTWPQYIKPSRYFCTNPSNGLKGHSTPCGVTLPPRPPQHNPIPYLHTSAGRIAFSRRARDFTAPNSRLLLWLVLALPASTLTFL